eukprot:7900774-Lingulodinium_polyedra.AAC.1
MLAQNETIQEKESVEIITAIARDLCAGKLDVTELYKARENVLVEKNLQVRKRPAAADGGSSSSKRQCSTSSTSCSSALRLPPVEPSWF